jgi:GNAT superfamily N-acetyltransferase
MGFAVTESHRIADSPVQIRTANVGDVGALLAYFERLGAGDRAMRFGWNPTPSATQFHRVANSGYSLVACLATGTVVGELLCSREGHSASIELSVDAQWRRRGLARLLVGVLLREAPRRGVRRIEAVCLTGSRAIALFTELGWEQVPGADRVVFYTTP